MILATGTPLKVVPGACHRDGVTLQVVFWLVTVVSVDAQSWHLSITLMDVSVKTSGSGFWLVTAWFCDLLYEF